MIRYMSYTYFVNHTEITALIFDISGAIADNPKNK